MPNFAAARLPFIASRLVWRWRWAPAPRTRRSSDGINGAAYGAGGGPGSYQEFAGSVGDRVFFDTDQTDLSDRAQATLAKQAAWLNRYSRYNFTVEGHADERGTREYNFALGSRRSETVKNYPHLQGRLRLAHQDDQLRQGAAGGDLRRHFLLVAEPPRRHRAQRRAGKLSRRRPARSSPSFCRGSGAKESRRRDRYGV